MGKKTSFTLKILAASLFVMLLTVFVMTDNVTLSSSDDGAAVDTGDVADGTYTGTGDGFNGPIEVEVTVEGGEIANVEVLSHDESPDISDPAFETVPSAIVENNSTDVDVASGATFSSEGIMSAVNNAISGDDSGSDATGTEDVSDVTFEDGTHTGVAEGAHGPIEVEVTVTDGEIAEITVLDHNETEGTADPAFEEVPPAIIDSNSTEVDAATGATLTSEGIMAAVENALSIEEEAPAEDVSYEDGTYTARVEGHNGPLEVEVTIENGEISNVAVLEHSETEDLSDPAIEDVPAAIVENNSTDVDVVSNATVTSEAIMEAVELALEDATETVTYTDGTYEGTTEGHNGPLNVEVTVENGEISNVTVLDHSETEDLSDPAIEDVPAAIVENNSTDVDVVSNATVTSEAIMDAVDNALEDATE